MAQTYPVSIQYDNEPPKSYSPDFQTREQFAAGWKATLTKARAAGAGNVVVKCSCPGKGDKQLAIRCYESDYYFLARYPLTGAQHANDCRYYAPDPSKSGLRGYQKGVVEEGPNGLVKIRLEIGLKKRTAAKDDAASANHSLPNDKERKSKSAMRLLGLLHFLWDAAGINAWWPAMEGKRLQGSVNRFLDRAAAQISAGKIKLDSVLLLADRNPNGEWARRNRERVTEALSEGTRLLAILPLAQHTPERAEENETTLRVSSFAGVPWMNMPEGLWARACKRFPRAITAWKHAQRTIAIIELDVRAGGNSASVVDLALMPVSKNWIPFDSMYELMIVEKLTAEGRGFLKPLRFDADEDVVFPDFVLRDTGDDTPLEVFGRSDEAYEVRKEIKTAYYQQEFGTGNWWCWNAAADPQGADIPPLPAPRKKSFNGCENNRG